MSAERVPQPRTRTGGGSSDRRRTSRAMPVTLSSELAPEWREYERTSTTVVSAYVAPIVGEYLAELERRLIAEGLRAPCSSCSRTAAS